MQKPRSQRRFKRQRWERRASTTEASAESETRKQHAQAGASSTRNRRIRERERPSPSNAWQAFAIGFLFCAAGVLITSLTLSPGTGVQSSELLITAANLAAMGVICFLAHWDVNRGRKAREWEVEEMPGGDQEE